MSHDWYKAEWNTTIRFGDNQPARGHFLDGGWCAGAADCAWTNGIYTRLAFRLPPPRFNPILVLDAAPCLPVESVSRQRLWVRVNNTPAGEFEFTASDRRVLAMPISRQVMAQEPVCVVTLFMPDAQPPIAAGPERDRRALGFRVSALCWADLWSDYQLGSRVAASTLRRPGSYMLYGWSHPEPRFTWTDGPKAALVMNPGEALQGCVLRARMHAFRADDGMPPQRVGVLINGEPVAQWRFSNSRPRVVSAPIPDGAAGPLWIELTVADPRSPLECGVGNDARLLGVGLSEFWIEKSGKAQQESVFDGWQATEPLEMPAGGGALTVRARLAASDGPLLLRARVDGEPVRVSAGALPAGVLDEDTSELLLWPPMLRQDGDTLLVFEQDPPETEAAAPTRLEALSLEQAAGRTAGGYLLSGWRAVGEAGARSDGGECALSIDVGDAVLPMRVELTLGDFETFVDAPADAVLVRVNERWQGRVAAEDKVKLVLDISPLDLMGEARAVIRLAPAAPLPVEDDEAEPEPPGVEPRLGFTLLDVKLLNGVMPQ